MITITPFQSLIKSRCGIQLDDDNSMQKLHNAIHERMQYQQQSSAEQYLLLLMHDHHEFQQLINLLTINETYFFREPEQIELLVKQLIPVLLQNKPSHRPLRILSAGCSSGEEPYTLAIALNEHYGEHSKALFQVIAVDIDSQVLAKARQGIYNEFSFRGVDPSIRQRYFNAHGFQYHLQPNIREQVIFKELNLLDATQAQQLAPCDLILFRNVSIYFDKPTRTQIQQNFAQLLSAHGILLVGLAETLANDLNVFKLNQYHDLFYFTHISTPNTAPTQSPTIISNTSNTPNKLQPLPTEQPHLQKIRTLLEDKRFDSAQPLVDTLLMQQEHQYEAHLFQAYLLMNRKQWSASIEHCQHVLTHQPWQLDATLLMGMIHKWQHHWSDAIHWFKQAVYAHSYSWLCHYYLADSYHHHQQPQALRSYRTALQLLLAHPQDTGLHIIPNELSIGEAKFLCEHRVRAGTQSHTGAR